MMHFSVFVSLYLTIKVCENLYGHEKTCFAAIDHPSFQIQFISDLNVHPMPFVMKISRKIKERSRLGGEEKVWLTDDMFVARSAQPCSSTLEVSYTSSPDTDQEHNISLTYFDDSDVIETFQFLLKTRVGFQEVQIMGLKRKFILLIRIGQIPVFVISKEAVRLFPIGSSKLVAIKRLNEYKDYNCLYMTKSNWETRVSLNITVEEQELLIRTKLIIFKLFTGYKGVKRAVRKSKLLAWPTKCTGTSPFGFNVIYNDIKPNDVLTIQFIGHQGNEIGFVNAPIDPALKHFAVSSTTLLGLKLRVATVLPNEALQVSNEYPKLVFEKKVRKLFQNVKVVNQTVQILGIIRLGMILDYQARMLYQHPRCKNLFVTRSLSYGECKFLLGQNPANFHKIFPYLEGYN